MPGPSVPRARARRVRRYRNRQQLLPLRSPGGRGRAERAGRRRHRGRQRHRAGHGAAVRGRGHAGRPVGRRAGPAGAGHGRAPGGWPRGPPRRRRRFAWEDVEGLAAATIVAFGAVHVVCNNAGVARGGRPGRSTLDDWRWVLGVDLWGVIHGVRAFVPRLLEQGEGGHIVNTASMTGLLPVRGLAGYSVAKMGVVALSEVLALDLDAEQAGVGVSVLLPGFIATRITESDRNRPEHLAERAAAPTAPRTTAGVESTMTRTRWPGWSSMRSAPASSGSSPTRATGRSSSSGRRASGTAAVRPSRRSGSDRPPPPAAV